MADNEEVKEDVEFINIIVKSEETEVHFKIKRTTPLKKLMNSFCQRQGKDPKSVRFSYDGETVLDTATPNDLEMEDGDCIDVMVGQLGGR
jgi:small ubiquitin-related modifier